MKRRTNTTSSENYKMSSTNGGRKLHLKKKVIKDDVTEEHLQT